MKCYLPLMIILLCACTRHETEHGLLMQREFSFPGEISSISCGERLLWIGTATGRIASFDPETERYSDQSFIEYGHIYCIREISDSLLLVGVRNAGLKLVKPDDGDEEATVLTHFTLSHRGVNYSPYSFIIKRQDARAAQEAGVRCDTLFCGTSNGLFWHPLPEDPESLGDTVELMPICGQDNDPGTRFCSVVNLGGEVYAGSNTGIFRILDAAAEAEEDRQERMGTVPVSHLSTLGFTLYTLDTDGNLFATEKLVHQRRFPDNPMAFFPGRNLSVAVSAYGIEISDRDGHSRQVPLNGRSAIGGSNNRGRECFAEKGDFFYVASSSGICRFPKNLNLSTDVTIISACAGRAADRIYALTEHGDLYRINTATGGSRFIRNIAPKGDSQVRSLCGYTGNRLVFHTASEVYEVRPRLFSRIREMKDMPEKSIGILSASVLPDGKVAVIYADGTLIYDTNTRKLDTLEVRGDSYVTDLEYLTDAAGNLAGIAAGTLNDGLQLIRDGSAVVIKDSGRKGSRYALDIASDGNELFMLVPGNPNRILNLRNGAEYVCDEEASGIFMTGGQLAATLATGGVRLPDGQIKYRDIMFLPRVMTIKDKSGQDVDGKWLISGNGCLLNVESGIGRLEMASIYAPGALVRFARWKGGCGLALMIIGLLLILLYSGLAGRRIFVAIRNWEAAYRIITDKKLEIRKLVSGIGRLSVLMDGSGSASVDGRTEKTAGRITKESGQTSPNDYYRAEAEAIMAAAAQLSEQMRLQDLVSDTFCRKYDEVSSRLEALLARLENELPPICRRVYAQAEDLARDGIISWSAAKAYGKSIEGADPLTLYRASLHAEAVGHLHGYSSGRALLANLLEGRDGRTSGRLPQKVMAGLKHLEEKAKRFSSMTTLDEVEAGISGFIADCDSFNSSGELKSLITEFLLSSLSKSGFNSESRLICALSENAVRSGNTFRMLIKCVSLTGQKECIRALAELSDTADRYAEEAKNCRKVLISRVPSEQLIRLRKRYNSEMKRKAALIYDLLDVHEKEMMKDIKLSHYSTSRRKDGNGSEAGQESSATWVMMLASVNESLTQNEIRDMCLSPEQSANFDRMKSWIRLKIDNYHNIKDLPSISGSPAVIVPTILELSKKMFRARK